MRRVLRECEKDRLECIWEETKLDPFDDVVVSWEAERPKVGSYLIQLSLDIAGWSPWFDYALWSAHSQHTFMKSLPEAGIQVFQDTVEVLGGKKASGLKIRVMAQDGASLEKFRALSISAIDRSKHAVSAKHSDHDSIELDISGISQVALPDDRRMRLCSPTSTTAVIRFLSRSSDLMPLKFADSIFDSAFDIYGNWILNTAQASHELGGAWRCYVSRLNSINPILDQLHKGYPVVVSVRGPLKGSPLPYESGHLLVVKGYDAKSQQVCCMDPAFPTNELTHVAYDLNDFLTAWGRRFGMAYIFDSISSI